MLSGQLVPSAAVTVYLLFRAGILTTRPAGCMRPSAIFCAALGLMGSDKFFCNLSKNVKQILEKVVIDTNFLYTMPILQNSSVQYFLPNGKQILDVVSKLHHTLPYRSKVVKQR